MNNVRHLPQPKKAGRRRVNQIPGLPVADVVTIAPRERPPTLEEKYADYEAAFDQIACGLLMAIREITALARKYPESHV